MARGSNLAIRLDWSSVPLLSHAEALVRQGFVTGASGRNWASYGAQVHLPAGFDDWRRNLLTDPQTSGGGDDVRLWGGRFAEGPAAVMREINASIPFDKRLWKQDIAGSKAHERQLNWIFAAVKGWDGSIEDATDPAKPSPPRSPRP